MARKKKGLPFVVQPRLQPIIEQVGTEESGIIEIERRGYLTVAEKSMVEQASVDLSDQQDLITAVRKIAKEEGRSIPEIFEELQNPNGSSLLEKHAILIAEASSSAQAQTRKIEIVAATALILSRIDSDWSVDQTMELHPDLLKGLHGLYLDEDARSLEAFENGEPSKAGESKK